MAKARHHALMYCYLLIGSENALGLAEFRAIQLMAALRLDEAVSVKGVVPHDFPVDIPAVGIKSLMNEMIRVVDNALIDELEKERKHLLNISSKICC
jgi:hypothetical protein